MSQNYKACPSQIKERSAVGIPVFYHACQGHSSFVASIERMNVPYDPGRARSHGSLFPCHRHADVLGIYRWKGRLSEERFRALP
eukprot:1257796-Pyramimonas_sp.AAC.1